MEIRQFTNKPHHRPGEYISDRFKQQQLKVSDIENSWIKDWSGESFWNHGTNLSNGVSVLFKKSHIFVINDVISFIDGRVTSVKLTINDQKIQIINVYAPNNSVDRKRFNVNISTMLDDNYVHILAGDFNCAQNNQKDRDPKQ